MNFIIKIYRTVICLGLLGLSMVISHAAFGMEQSLEESKALYLKNNRDYFTELSEKITNNLEHFKLIHDQKSLQRISGLITYYQEVTQDKNAFCELLVKIGQLLQQPQQPEKKDQQNAQVQSWKTLLDYYSGLLKSNQEEFVNDIMECDTVTGKNMFQLVDETIQNYCKATNNPDAYNELTIAIWTFTTTEHSSVAKKDTSEAKKEEIITELLFPRYYQGTNSIIPVIMQKVDSYAAPTVITPEAIDNEDRLKQLSDKINLGNKAGVTRELCQLKTIDQGDTSYAKTRYMPDMCPGLALFNAVQIIKKETGKIADFASLPNMGMAWDFVLSRKLQPLLATPEVEQMVQQVVPKIGFSLNDFTIIENVKEFCRSEDESKMKHDLELLVRVQEGIQQPFFYHAFIIGSTDLRMDQQELSGNRPGTMHWFAVVVGKYNNTLTYYVADTLPSQYHLQEGTYLRGRLDCLIGMLEGGLN